MSRVAGRQWSERTCPTVPGKSRQTPTLTIQLGEELDQLVVDWAEFSGRSKSHVVRVALAQGFKVLAENPHLLPPKVNTEALRPPRGRKKKRS